METFKMKCLHRLNCVFETKMSLELDARCDWKSVQDFRRCCRPRLSI